MKSKIASIFFFCFLFFTQNNFLFAQIDHFICGTEVRMEKLYRDHPELQEVNEKPAQNPLQNKVLSVDSSGSALYIIPVVFHILYETSADDISDAQVIDAINILNRDWRRRNADTTEVIPEFKKLIADSKIEFRLATKDPNGNCTTGIEHIYSYTTNSGGENCKFDQWPRDKYLNIWVVKNIGSGLYSAAGYANLPSAVAGVYSVWDGVVMDNSYVGSIGTSSVFTSRGLNLEIAHYLGLHHPWGTSTIGTVCGDDGIADTPVTKGWLKCPSSPQNAKVCDTSVVENYQNFMEYSFCNLMFTPGQVAYMYQTLNSPVSGRNNLSTPANLAATGIDSASLAAPPLCPPVADFTAYKNFVCKGGTTTFFDHSWRSMPTSWLWTFENAAPATSTSANPTVTFNKVGPQKVTLVVSNAAGSDTLTENNFIVVYPDSANYSGVFSEDFENNDFNVDTLWTVEHTRNPGPVWTLTDSASFSGTHSIMLDMSEAPDLGYPATFVTPTFNLSKCVQGTAQLSFKYSCATSAPDTSSIDEVLNIYSSFGCGLWVLRKTIKGLALANTGYSLDPYVPSSSSSWTSFSYNLPAPALGGAQRFKFEYISGTYSNNIYIDDINISAAILGVNEIQNYFFDLNVFPNPANGNPDVTINYTLSSSEKVRLSLVDMVGREIVVSDEQQSAGKKSFVLDRNAFNLKPGIYLVKVSNGSSYSTQKLLLTN